MKKYEHIYHVLHNQITGNTLEPDSPLPTEDVLAATHGVSRQTVRKALDMLRKDELIYSVQGSGSYVRAREVTKPQNRHIAVISTYFSEYIFPSILRGISEIAVENDYSIEIATSNNSTSQERDILQNLQNKPIAGIIAEGTKAALPNPNLELYRQFSRRGIPVVFINSFYPELINPRILSVTTDDFNGGKRIGQDLVDQGHTTIGCIFKSDDAQGIARYSGFLSVLAENHIPFNDRYFMWYTSETRRVLYNSPLFDDLLTECTAIVCYNDQVAEMVCSCLRRSDHNIRTIASFDRHMNPDLVPDDVQFYSLPHPRKELGRVAAQKLVNLLNGQAETSAVLPWGNV